jgi:hypothetical protein
LCLKSANIPYKEEYVGVGLLGRRKSLIAAAGVLGILLIVAAGVSLYLVLRPETSAAVLCNDRGKGSLLDEAKSVFSGDASKKLDQYKTLADRAKTIKEYDQQPNCVYPVMYNQYLTRDVRGAAASLKQFEKIQADKEFAKDIYGDFETSGLSDKIKIDEKIENDPNFIGGGSIPGFPAVQGSKQ